MDLLLKKGVYRINEKILEHARKGYSLKHYSNIGVQIAYELAKKIINQHLQSIQLQ